MFFELKGGAMKVISVNRKARHDYDILFTIEAGIALQGTEVKSIRLGRVNLKDSFAKVEKGEAFLYNLHISPYEQGNRYNPDPTRRRKLLLHKAEIRRLVGKTEQKGLTLVPLSLYFNNGKVKLELALARGKKLYDKRRTIAERDAKRELEREFKQRQRWARY